MSKKPKILFSQQEAERRLKEKLAALLDRSWQQMSEAPSKALVWALEAEKLAKKLKTERSVAKARFHQGWCHFFSGHYKDSLNNFYRSLQYFQIANDPFWLSRIYNGIGSARQALANFSEALMAYYRSRDYAIEAANEPAKFATMVNIANVQLDLEAYQDAMKSLDEAERQRKAPVPDEMLLDFRMARAILLLRLGDTPLGEANLKKAVEFARELNFRTHIFDGLLELALLDAKKGNRSQALEHVQLAVAEALALGDSGLLATAYWHRGEVFRIHNERGEALQSLQQCLYFLEGKDNKISLKAHQTFAEIYESTGQTDLALTHWKQSFQLDRKIYARDTHYQVEAVQTQINVEKKQREADLERVRNKELKEKNQQLELINFIGREISASLDLNHIVKMLYQRFNEAMQIDVCGVALVNPIKKILYFRHFVDHGKLVEPFSIPLSKAFSYAAYCVRHREVVLSFDARADAHRLFGEGDEYIAPGSLIYVPLFENNEVFALFTVQVNRVNAMTNQQFELINSVSSFLTVAVQNCLTHEKVHTLTKEVIEEKKAIEYLAHHDRLTKLNNRIGLEQEFERLTKTQSNRQRQVPFALVYIDLDNFKPVNDLYGHEFGDEVLSILSERMRRAVRKTDVVARVGGDEFIILLNNVYDSNGVHGVVDQLMNKIRSPMSLHRKLVKLSASIGVVFYPEHGTSLKGLMRRADEAMYGIKKRGKDNIAYYGAEQA